MEGKDAKIPRLEYYTVDLTANEVNWKMRSQSILLY
jgi:hypothetical protein